MRDGAATLARRASALTAGRAAAVRISATASVSLFLAARMGELLAASLPEIAVLTTRTPVDLAEQDAEIALRMRRAPEQGSVAARRVGKLAFAVYAQRDYWQARARDDPWRTADVIGLPQTSRAPSQSRWLDDAAGGRGANIRLRLGEVFLRHRAVRDGVGVSLLPCFLGDTDPALVRVIEPPAALAESVFLIVHEDMRRAEPVRAVADALAQLFRRARDELAGLPAAPVRAVITRTAAVR
jgi:LysR substrate binding domain-containing protein